MRKPRVPKPIHPESAEREYRRYLNSYVNAYIRFMREGLRQNLPELRDVSAKEQPRVDVNIEERIGRVFKYVQDQLLFHFPQAVLKSWAFSMIARVNRNSKQQTAKQFKSGFKKAGKEMETDDFEPFMREQELTPYYQNAAEENVGLIRSIPLEKLPTLKNALVAMITADQSSADIQKVLQKNFAMTRGKAALIARDQVGKINGALEEYRQKQLGVKRYIWRTSEDSRVRKDHRELDGTLQSWAKPPIVDHKTGRRAHPKRDYQCRCWAEPVLDDVIES